MLCRANDSTSCGEYRGRDLDSPALQLLQIKLVLVPQHRRQIIQHRDLARNAAQPFRELSSAEVIVPARAQNHKIKLVKADRTPPVDDLRFHSGRSQVWKQQPFALRAFWQA